MEAPHSPLPRSPAASLLGDLQALGGAGAEVVDLAMDRASSGEPGVVRIGVHRSGNRPTGGLEDFDILLTSDPEAPRPWVGVATLDGVVAGLIAAVEAQPVASAVAAQILRASLEVSFEAALVAESTAYSMLLSCEGFRDWRRANPARRRTDGGSPRVLQSGGVIRLNRPELRNAFDARMRDELCEALELARYGEGPVELSGEGPAFSSGGDLDEFGRADDVGQAHLIRTLRSPARLVHLMSDRVTARLHGACVGAGIEIPAAAGRVTARDGVMFRLPEVSMGLIPGAGGTATLPRRIGRRRTCFMAITGAAIDLPTALAWGLVDAVNA